MENSATKLDAQLTALEKTDEPTTEIIDQLIELVRESSAANPQRCMRAADRIVEMAQALEYRVGEAYGRGYRGFCRYMLSDHEGALPELYAAKSLIEEAGDRRGRSMILMSLAQVHLSMGNYERALANSHEGLKVLEHSGDEFETAWTYYGLGNGYQEMGDHETALTYHQRSLALFEKIENNRRAIAGRARALNGIANVYQTRGEFDRALEFHAQSLTLFREYGGPIGEARALNDLGVLETQRGNLKEALDLHRRSLALREQSGNRQAQSTSLINLGQVCLELGHTAEALAVLQQALRIASEIKSKPRIFKAHQFLSQAYEATGDYLRALEHQRHFQAVREEVSGNAAATKIKNLEIGFQVEKSQQQAEIERLRNVELKEVNDRLQRLLSELQEAQSQIIQTEKMAALGSLVAGVVHELNNPVGALKSATDVAKRVLRALIDLLGDLPALEGDERLNKLITTIQESHRIQGSGLERISKIVTSLKSFANLDQSEFREFDLHESLESVLALLEPELGDRITVNRDFGRLPLVLCYPAEINQLFLNLLTNAVEAIRGQGTIELRTASQNGAVAIEISDDGIGIPAQRLETLFEPQFSRTGSRVKAGLGLFTCYRIVQKHNGSIEVSSTQDEGSTFSITLPLTPQSD